MLRLIAVLALLCPPSRAAAADFAGLRELPPDLWSGLKEEGKTDGLLTIAGAGAAAGIATTGDTQIKDTLQRHTPLGQGATRTGAAIGNYGSLAGAAAAAYLGGVYGEAPRLEEFGVAGLEALAIAGAETETLKYAVRRERPDHSDHYSFPSGHSSGSFALATTAACEFGWKAGVPAYLAAGFVGYTRMEMNKHYLSDVLFGAGLGIASGRAVCKVRRRRRPERFAVEPLLLPGGGGLLVRF